MPNNEVVTPNATLAAQVAQDLIQSDLVPERKSAELLTKLTAGSITAEDWLLYVELAITDRPTDSSEARANDDQ